MKLLLRVLPVAAETDCRAAAHALLRRTLSQIRPDVAPADWRFERAPHGKPRVASPLPALNFSLTHARGLAACAAIEAELEVGVDAEPLGRRLDPLRLAARYFADGEAAALAAIADEGERRRAFLRLWTLKEAVVKALGTGIAGSLQGFSFSLDDPPIFLPHDPALGTANDWFFQRRDIDCLNVGGFSAALALRGALAQKIDIDFQIVESPP